MNVDNFLDIANNAKPSAFIFDFDGVICDTEKLHFAAWNKGFKTLGFALTEKDYLPLKSTGRKNIVAAGAKKLSRSITPEEANLINEVKDSTFKELCRHIDNSLLTTGVVDFLREIRSLGFPVAVASSASTTTSLLKKLKLNPYFDTVVDGNLNLPKKPEPDIFLTAAKRLGASPEGCIVFEDSIAGINAALNACMQVVAVGGIIHPQALMCIKDFSQLV